MPDARVEAAGIDDVRTIQRRRGLGDTAIRLSLELAERGTAWVARDQSEAIGIVLARASGEERYVGDLFVEASYRGTGVGGSLLQAAFADVDDVARSMRVDPADPAGLALAMRAGLSLREPLLRVAGAIPKEEELARMAAGDYRFDVAAVDPIGHAFGLRDLDRTTRGTVRDADHEEFARRATGHAFFLRGELVAYAYVWPDGRVGPMGFASPAYAVQILAYALLTLARQYGASWCTLLVPGTNVRIARAALRAGLRIEEEAVIASDAAEPNLSRYVGYHWLNL